MHYSKDLELHRTVIFFSKHYFIYFDGHLYIGTHLNRKIRYTFILKDIRQSLCSKTLSLLHLSCYFKTKHLHIFKYMGKTFCIYTNLCYNSDHNYQSSWCSRVMLLSLNYQYYGYYSVDMHVCYFKYYLSRYSCT